MPQFPSDTNVTDHQTSNAAEEPGRKHIKDNLSLNIDNDFPLFMTQMFNRYLMVDWKKHLFPKWTIVSVSIFYVNTQTIGKIRSQGTEVQNTDFSLFGQIYPPAEFVSITPRSNNVYVYSSILWVIPPLCHFFLFFYFK